MLKKVLLAIAKKLIPIIWDLMIPEIEKWLKNAIEQIAERQKDVLIQNLKNEMAKIVITDSPSPNTEKK